MAWCTRPSSSTAAVHEYTAREYTARVALGVRRCLFGEKNLDAERSNDVLYCMYEKLQQHNKQNYTPVQLQIVSPCHLFVKASASPSSSATNAPNTTQGFCCCCCCCALLFLPW